MIQHTRILQSFLSFLAIVTTVFFASPADAKTPVCTFTISAVNFGNIDLTANTVFDTTATLQVNCTDGGGGDAIRICPNINAGTGGTTTGNPRFAKSGANALNFNLYSDSARTTVWGSTQWGFPSFQPPALSITLNNNGDGSLTTTVFARISAGQQALPPGTYTSSFTGSNTQMAYDRSTSSCATVGTQNSTTAAFTLTAVYPAVCAVNATLHNFGSSTSLSSNTDASSTVTATCSATTPYNIGLDAGTGTGASVTTRKMTSGANTINYSLYTNSGRTTAWGNTVGTNTVAGTGTGSGQALTVFGRVPAQTTPTPATYSDTIVTTVTY